MPTPPTKTTAAEFAGILGHLCLYLVFLFAGSSCLVAYGAGAITLILWLSSASLLLAQFLWLGLWILLLLFAWSFAALTKRLRMLAICALCAYASLLTLAVVHWHHEDLVRSSTRRLPLVLQDSEVIQVAEAEYCVVVAFRMTGRGRLNFQAGDVPTAEGFSSWRETPMQHGVSSHGPWESISELLCAPFETSQKEVVSAALNRPGSYYAVRGGAIVVVMPELGWIVYSLFTDD